MPSTVAVIGAGLAGIACARRLAEAGVHARVFEAQRTPGGRLATRRFARASFDHGAQYLTATDGGLLDLLEAAEAAGAAGRWQPALAGSRTAGRPVGRRAGHECAAAIPRPGPRRRVWDPDRAYRTRTSRLGAARRSRARAHGPRRRRARPAGAGCRRARRVPHERRRARQSRADGPLLGGARRFRGGGPRGVPDAGITGDGILAWYARDASKPGREARDTFVLHATADWSRESSTSRRTRCSVRCWTAFPSTSAGRCRAHSLRMRTAGVMRASKSRSARTAFTIRSPASDSAGTGAGTRARRRHGSRAERSVRRSRRRGR